MECGDQCVVWDELVICCGKVCVYIVDGVGQFVEDYCGVWCFQVYEVGCDWCVDYYDDCFYEFGCDVECDYVGICVDCCVGDGFDDVGDGVCVDCCYVDCVGVVECVCDVGVDDEWQYGVEQQ